jgi:hypothetical protein
VRAARRPRLWQEVAVIAVCYWLYSAVRNAVPSEEPAARVRALDLYGLERSLHIDIEHPVNALVAHTSWLAYACNYYYATLHFAVTIGVLAWLYLRHPLRYRSVRTVLFATNLIGLAGFWLFSLAPPRLMGHGFVDTVVAFHTWGSWASASVADASNQFAAMPSLHIAWAVWCAVSVLTLARRRWVRVLAALYPLLTLFVIIGTANHFVLDAVGGALTVAAGFAVQRVLSGRSPYAVPVRASRTATAPELAAA